MVSLLSRRRPKLKNIDRSSAQQLAITVGNVTVIITDFKEKTRSSSTSSSTVTSSAGSEQQHLSSSSESTDKGSSRASTPRRDHSSGHNETLWSARRVSLGQARSSSIHTCNCYSHLTWKRDLSNPSRHCPSWRAGRHYLFETLVEHLVDWCVDVDVSHAETHRIPPDNNPVRASRKWARSSLRRPRSLSFNCADGRFDFVFRI